MGHPFVSWTTRFQNKKHTDSRAHTQERRIKKAISEECSDPGDKRFKNS